MILSQKTEIVKIDVELPYRLYDTIDNCYVGFKTSGAYGRVTVKSMWKKSNHAASAFKLHTGARIADQSRYDIIT